MADERNQGNESTNGGDADGEGMIPLEPDPPTESAANQDSPGSGSSRNDAGVPRIEAAGLLDDFDPDADFERDPEVDRALGMPVADARHEHASVPRPKPKPKAAEHDVLAAHPDRWIIRSTMPGFRVCLIAAGVVLLAMLLMIGVQGGDSPWLQAAMTVYNTVFHAATGVLAVLIVCVLIERGFNHPELVAARMLVASAIFHLGLTLQIPITGRVDEHLAAAGLYALVVWAMFRLPRQEIGILCAAHLSLWVFVQIGYSLSSALGSG